MTHTRPLRAVVAVALALLFAFALYAPAQPTAPDAVPDQNTDTDTDADTDAQAADADAGTPPADVPVESFLDIAYDEVEGVRANALSLDIYRPERGDDDDGDDDGGEKALLPVVVYVHGGGWKNGDKRRVGLKPALFARAGCLFVSVNYRLLPAGEHPTNVQDVANAIAWVADNIGEYGGDVERIVLIGHSAGAHLVALVATGQEWLEAAGENRSRIKGVVPLDTASYDIVRKVDENPNARAGTVEAFGTDTDVWMDASPLLHVAADVGIPPFLLVHIATRRDSGGQSEAMAAALEHEGIEATVFSADDRTHGSLNQRFGERGDPTTRAALEFYASCVDGIDVTAADPLPEVERDTSALDEVDADRLLEVVGDLGLTQAQRTSLRASLRGVRNDDEATRRGRVVDALAEVLTDEQWTHLLESLDASPDRDDPDSGD